MAAVDRQLLFLDPAGGAARSAVGAMSPRRLEVGMEVGEERLRSQRSAVERAAGPRDVLRSGLRSKDSSADWKVSHSGKPVRFSKILGNLPFIMAWRGSYALRHFLMSLVSLWPTAPGTGFLENLPIFRSRPEPRFAQEPPGLAPSRRLFRFSASVDSQDDADLVRGGSPGLRPSRPAHWRIGCRARLRRPSDLKHHGRRIA